MVLVYMVRTIYWLAAALSTGAALLVTASMLIAEGATQSAMNWGITLTVSIFFACLALLSLGIAHYLTGIGLLTRTQQNEQAAAVWHNWSRLSIIMIIGGTMLGALLLAGVYAMPDRIDQGFAVFG
jgi:hypothetical protein